MIIYNRNGDELIDAPVTSSAVRKRVLMGDNYVSLPFSHDTYIDFAPGANINYKTGHAIFEATHGTAPNIAGKDVVNPCSIILSAVMMLEYLGWKEAAALIEKALEQSFLDARATHDLARFMPGGTSLSTTAFTREIVERIEK